MSCLCLHFSHVFVVKLQWKGKCDSDVMYIPKSKEEKSSDIDNSQKDMCLMCSGYTDFPGLSSKEHFD